MEILIDGERWVDDQEVLPYLRKRGAPHSVDTIGVLWSRAGRRRTSQGRCMKCIYCLKDRDVTFRGVEHVIPGAFGTFGSNTPTLDCVCDEFNAYFGRELDQLLARDTIEGISRHTRGRLSSESRAQRKLEISLAEGPEVGPLAGLRVSVDGTTGKLMRPRTQFHAFNFQTKQNEVYLIEQISGLTLPEAIYGAPGNNGVKGTWQVKAFAASKEAYDALVAALQANGIDYRPGEPFQIPQSSAEASGNEPTLPVYIEGEVDTPHKRALAKILMNFVAWTLGCEEALKVQWDFLRIYVRRAEGLIKSRMTEQPFCGGQETETQRFADDSIDIRIENLETNIVGSIQFYGRFTYGKRCTGLRSRDRLPVHSRIRTDPWRKALDRGRGEWDRTGWHWRVIGSGDNGALCVQHRYRHQPADKAASCLL